MFTQPQQTHNQQQAGVWQTHLEDANEILLVDAEKMAVVFSQDDGGGSGGVVQQSQLAKVFTLM